LKCRALAIVSLLILSSAQAQRVTFPGAAPDPYVMAVGSGEPDGSTIPSPPGFTNSNGKTLQSSILAAPSTTAVIVTTWQSNIENAASGTYTTTNTLASNFSIYDAGIYHCDNPVLGTALNNAGLGSNSANCQIADGLINAGTYTQVVMVPVAIGGTLCSDWVSGALSNRISVAVKRLQSRGLTVGTGFTGDTWILAHGGETDAGASTPRATLATCIRNFAAAWTTAGLSGFRFFVPTESMVSNVTNSTVTGAQADAVASGCSTCRAGYNVDGLTSGTNRQADGTHLTATGASNLASGDVGIIQNCKATSC
jgi:hypothetical protein